MSPADTDDHNQRVRLLRGQQKTFALSQGVRSHPEEAVAQTPISKALPVTRLPKNPLWDSAILSSAKYRGMFKQLHKTILNKILDLMLSSRRMSVEKGDILKQ